MLVASIAVIVFVAVYVLIATERVHRTAAALGGAGVMLLIHATDAEKAFYDLHAGVDWNVIFLLLGMMVIVGVVKQTGLFEYLAIWTVKVARGRPYRLMVLLCILTASASALLDNVTTVLLIAPMTLAICRRLHLEVAPYLIAQTMASNIGGMSTLVGDPPNIIIASRGGLTFNDFLVHLLPLAVGLMAAFVLMCRLLFRSTFVYNEEHAAEVAKLNEREAITDPKLLWRSLVVLGAVVVAFVLHPVLHYEPSVIALIGGGILVAFTHVSVAETLREVEWATLVFFAGLFVMVGSLVNVGVIGKVSAFAAEEMQGNTTLAAMVLLWGSAVLSAIIDNIPYVATMAPIVADLVPTVGGRDHVLWWALAMGADLGGNATAIGASANVVVIGIAERNGVKITFWGFTKYGLVVTFVTVALCVPYIWLRYLG